MTPRQDARRRAAFAARVVAVLAGGVALGAAGAATLAAWQEPEVAATNFAAAQFESQSQGADGAWRHHDTSSPAALSIDLDDLSPGGTAAEPEAGASRYGFLNLRMSANSTAGGTAVLSQVGADFALADVLEYRVVARQASTAQCTEADFSASASYLAGGPDAYIPLTTSQPTGVGLDLEPGAQNDAGVCVDIRVAKPEVGDTGQAVQGASSRVGLLFTVTQR